MIQVRVGVDGLVINSRSLGWWTNVLLSGQAVHNCVTRGCGMTYHAQETLGDVWVTLWDHQTTFLVLHGEPGSMFFEADF